MTRRRDEHDREDWSRWDWRRPCEVVGCDPTDPREKARRLAEGTAGMRRMERDEADRLGGWDDEPPRAGTVYYCAGPGETRAACTTAAEWDAAVGRRGGD
jgi:hypothetical protein